MKLNSINPHDQSVVGEVDISTEQDVKLVVEKARTLLTLDIFPFRIQTMANEQLDSYPQALTEFNALRGQPFSPESYRAGLLNVLSAGLSEDINPKSLFTYLVDGSGVAIQRATEAGDPSVEDFTKGQRGFKAALDRLTSTPKPQTPSRPQTGVAAG